MNRYTEWKHSVLDQKQTLWEPDHSDFATTHYISVRNRSRIATIAEKRDTTQGHAGKDKTTTEQ